MSGTGQPGNRAPTRLTPLAQDEPLGRTEDGQSVYATMGFRQALQRLQDLLGQPSGSGGTGGGGGGGGLTVSEQLTLLSESITNLQAAGGSETGLTARVGAVESAISNLVRIAMLPAPKPPVLWLPGPPPLEAGPGIMINSGTLTVTRPFAIYAPAVNGDLPGPTLIADAVGACVMVQVA